MKETLKTLTQEYMFKNALCSIMCSCEKVKVINSSSTVISWAILYIVNRSICINMDKLQKNTVAKKIKKKAQSKCTVWHHS